MAIFFWSNQGWEIEDNPAATAFEIFWMIFEPILFGVTGTQIKINELNPEIVTYSLAILIVGVFIRIVLTILMGIGCKLNLKEKLFVALSWMSKATVQVISSDFSRSRSGLICHFHYIRRHIETIFLLNEC